MNGVLIREGIGRGDWKNIGDYIHSIAQRQYFDKIDCYIEIEKLSDYKVEGDEKINVIMNGWFMWYPEKFPPSACINPLFISFHLSPDMEDKFFTPKTIAYLKQYEPIGTRDTLTKDLLVKYGINSYFSGCLTLTLGKTYQNDGNGSQIYIIDPLIPYALDKNVLSKGMTLMKSLLYLLFNCKKVSKLSRKYCHQRQTFISKISRKLDKLIETAFFYKVYSKCFSEDILLEAEYLSQIVDNRLSNEEKFVLAEQRLEMYSKARFIITRRIHAALPCLAMNTPVILTVTDDMMSVNPKEKAAGGRFGGIIDLFNSKKFTQHGIESVGCEDKITKDNFPSNPDKYKYYRDLLNEKVTNFINSLKK